MRRKRSARHSLATRYEFVALNAGSLNASTMTLVDGSKTEVGNPQEA